MKFKLEIDLESSAFAECNGVEIARILRKHADAVDHNCLSSGVNLSIKDINGAYVGCMYLTEKE